MTKMRFIATFADDLKRTVVVDNHDGSTGFYTMQIDDKSYHVDAQLMKSNIVSMLIDSRSYDIDVEKVSKEPLDGRLGVRVRGRVVRFEMLDERRQKMKEAASSQFAVAGAAVVNSPMPGKIVKLLVGVGQEVEQGQGLVVVEAMKMENELKSPKAGVVTLVRTKEGDTVEGGTPLIVIE